MLPGEEMETGCGRCGKGPVRVVPNRPTRERRCEACGTNYGALDPRIHGDKQVVTLLIHEGPNKEGRYSYTEIWWHENFHMGPQWFGQCFLSDPARAQREAEANGFQVQVIDQRSSAGRRGLAPLPTVRR